MDMQTIQVIAITLTFVVIVSLAIFVIDKMNWWGGVGKTCLVMWNIISAIFILIGTMISIIFLVIAGILFASGKD